MLRLQWQHKLIETNQDAEDMRQLYNTTAHSVAAFDTESTGLDIILDTPFLYQFGWADLTTMKGYTFIVDLEHTPVLARQVIRVWHCLVKSCAIYLGHNVKYDLHMVHNVDLPYAYENLSDTMFYIRLGTDAIQQDKGGAPLKLKEFAQRYIDPNARDFEKKLKEERSEIAKKLNRSLRVRLKWNKKAVEDFFKDVLNSPTDLPEPQRTAYSQWLQEEVPDYLVEKINGVVDKDDIGYDKLNRTNIIEYAHYDIVYTIETYLLTAPAVEQRDNMEALRIENENIIPLFKMERVGFLTDKQYLLESKERMADYIRIRRADMHILAGEDVKTGQHARIKDLLENRFCLENVVSTGKEELSLLCSELKRSGENQDAVAFIEVVQELRTLEKWYATYILRFLKQLNYKDRIHTTINQVKAVTGRVSSDFQQFPKKGLKTIDGVELFQPRRMVQVDTEAGYIGMVYLDYSQIELRLQALYTILVGHPDLNLCRAYMPYRCGTYVGDEAHQRYITFDYNNAEHLAHAYDWVWYYEERPNDRWTPTDVHGATTKHAFHIDEQHEEYHDLRYVGKRVNFSKNYGASRVRVRAMFPEFSEEQITDIDDAYYKAFPGVKEYHKYCEAVAKTKPYGMNLFGVKYYNQTGHNLKNTLIQGSGAYFLKLKIIKINEYLTQRGCASRFQMQIHDELSFEWHKTDDPIIFFEIQTLMQEFDGALVPIVADMELTTTTWADKFEVHTQEEFYESNNRD